MKQIAYRMIGIFFAVCNDVLLIKIAHQGIEEEYSCYTKDGKFVAKTHI